MSQIFIEKYSWCVIIITEMLLSGFADLRVRETGFTGDSSSGTAS